jgi:hypothetical protein
VLKRTAFILNRFPSNSLFYIVVSAGLIVPTMAVVMSLWLSELGPQPPSQGYISPVSEEVREQQDLEAQRTMADQAKRMADLTVAQMLIGLLTLLGLGVTIYYTRHTAMAALRAVEAAQHANKISDRTARQQLRAYISVAEAHAAFAEGNRPIFQIILANRGQTPAYEVVGKIAAYARGLPLTEFLSFRSDAETKQIGVMGPSSEFHMRLTGELGFDNDLIVLIAKREMAIFVLGRIDYKDVFERKWYTEFTVVFDDFSLKDPKHQMPAWISGNKST